MDIVTQVAFLITCQDVSMQLPFTLEKGAAITVMKLAITTSLCCITNQFSMGKSMAKGATQVVCLFIQDVLANCFICKHW
ncbi:hypothetical protein Y1Q_0008092 [Alligator mississippiensis]|uniref:Uncharacterized protein n=1 Tax=Alligator mississippiensis TaxID=8496 RepID=A0A151NFH4_ALLMI|nr:hypothetical protein Y1Q_0008092 [Alligator mississippiensis]